MNASPEQALVDPGPDPHQVELFAEMIPRASALLWPASAVLGGWASYTADRPWAALTAFVVFTAVHIGLSWDHIRGRSKVETRALPRAVANFVCLAVFAWAGGVGGEPWLLALVSVAAGVFGGSVDRSRVRQAGAVVGILTGQLLVGLPWQSVVSTALGLTAVAVFCEQLHLPLRGFTLAARRARTDLQATVSELEAAHAELADSNRALERALEFRKRFVATMSHEIRTPLNGVLGMAELMADAELTPEQQHMVSVIRSSGHGLLEVVNDVLDLARLEAGRLEVERRPFGPGALLDEVVELLRHGELSPGVALRSEAQGLPSTVSGDPTRLRQVLFNLVGNAIKFTRAGSITVRSSWSGSRLHIEVVDTGCGIAPEQQSRLFEPFEQATAGTARTYGGSGLGLAISRQLVEVMGGQLQVDSAVGRGSTFSFDIPAPVVDEPASVVKVVRQWDGRALVVDDNPVNLAVARAMLERLGLRVQTAGSGQVALELVGENSAYDIVFMDVQMPGMDGRQTTARLRQGGLTCPIVALTAGVTEAEQAEHRAAGMVDVLEKPLTLAALGRVLSALAGR